MSVFPQDSEEQLYSHRIFFFQSSRANCKSDGTVQLTVELWVEQAPIACSKHCQNYLFSLPSTLEELNLFTKSSYPKDQPETVRKAGTKSLAKL